MQSKRTQALGGRQYRHLSASTCSDDDSWIGQASFFRGCAAVSRLPADWRAQSTGVWVRWVRLVRAVRYGYAPACSAMGIRGTCKKAAAVDFLSFDFLSPTPVILRPSHLRLPAGSLFVTCFVAVDPRVYPLRPPCALAPATKRQKLRRNYFAVAQVLCLQHFQLFAWAPKSAVFPRFSLRNGPVAAIRRVARLCSRLFLFWSEAAVS